MKEKRRDPRLRMDWAVEYRVFEDGKSKNAVTSNRIANVGAGGFCLASASPLEKDTLIQFAITPGGGAKPIIGVARTVWSGASNGSFKIGARFVWASWEGTPAQPQIVAYIRGRLPVKPA